MKYSEIRNEIKSGDLIAFSGGDWKSISGIKVNLIRIFTRSTYSHVGIAWKTSGRIFVLEATKPKLRIYPLSLHGDFFLVPLDANWSNETEEFALSKIGTKYSEHSAILAFFAPLSDGNIQQCAAYAREIMEKDGIDLGSFSRPDTVVQAALDLGKKLMFVKGNV